MQKNVIRKLLSPFSLQCSRFLMRFLLSVLVLIALIHCGVKAPPLPPLAITPQDSEITPSPSPQPTSIEE